MLSSARGSSIDTKWKSNIIEMVWLGEALGNPRKVLIPGLSLAELI